MKYIAWNDRHIFEYDGEKLYCNICNSELILKKQYKYISVKGCSNIQCKTNTVTKKKDFLHCILPTEQLEAYNLKLKNSKKNSSKTIKKLWTIEYWMSEGFTESEAIQLLEEKRNKIRESVINAINVDKEAFIKKSQSKNYYNLDVIREEYNCSIEEAKKISDYRKNETSCFRSEFWIKKGYSEIEAKQKISEIQRENSKKFSKKRKENSEEYKDYSPRQLDYWIKKGYSENESIEKRKILNTANGLDFYIKKYGEDEGLKRYNKRIENWKNKVFNNNSCISTGYSKSSQIFINEILCELPEELKEKAEYGKKENFITYNNKHYKFDLTIGKKIIEFNNDFWHCNPKFYDKDFIHPVKQTTAENIWDYDKLKTEAAKKYGYEILTVWDSDYYHNKNKIINECIIFLMGNK